MLSKAWGGGACMHTCAPRGQNQRMANRAHRSLNEPFIDISSFACTPPPLLSWEHACFTYFRFYSLPMMGRPPCPRPTPFFLLFCLPTVTTYNIDTMIERNSSGEGNYGRPLVY